MTYLYVLGEWLLGRFFEWLTPIDLNDLEMEEEPDNFLG